MNSPPSHTNDGKSEAPRPRVGACGALQEVKQIKIRSSTPNALLDKKLCDVAWVFGLAGGRPGFTKPNFLRRRAR